MNASGTKNNFAADLASGPAAIGSVIALPGNVIESTERQCHDATGFDPMSTVVTT